MPKKRIPKRHRRRCSICDKTGHDKRNCLVSENVNKPQVISEPGPTTEIIEPLATIFLSKIEKNSKLVIVKNHGEISHSPHIVNLRNKLTQNNKNWDKVPAYRELKKQVKTQPTDVPKIIRDANKQKIEHKNLVQAVDKTNEHLKKMSTKVSMSFKPTQRKNLKINKKKPPKILNKEYKSLGGSQTLFLEVSHGESSHTLIPYGGLRSKLKTSKKKLNTNSILNRVKKLPELITKKRLAAAIIIVLVIIAIPFPAVAYYNRINFAGHRIIEESTNAFLSLQSSTVAAFGSNIDQAQNDLSIALQSFENANNIIEKEHNIILAIAKFIPIVRSKVLDGQHILNAGQKLALGNAYLLKGVSEANSETEKPLTDRFEIVKNHLNASIAQYVDAEESLNKIHTNSLPLEYQPLFSDFKILFSTLIDDMKDMVELADAVETVFGQDDFKRYLIILQNNHELRPTGGFMGSYAIADFQKGKLLNIDLPGGGTYDLQGQLDVYVEPPLPLQLVNSRWEFQDSNWFPDFSATGKKAAWFYQHGRQTTVDGVIAINASVLERFLKVVGPTAQEEYGLLLTAGEVLQNIENHVSQGDHKNENKPKEILSDILDQFITGLTEINTLDITQLLAESHEALEEKEIQVYFTDKKVQKNMRDFGWTGEILNTKKNQDYLHVSVANIGGGKSDANTTQVLEHQSLIEEDGSIINTLVIKREHNNKIGNELYDTANIAYVRVYVPEGAELLEVNGFTYPPEDLFHVPKPWYKIDEDLKEIEKNELLEPKSGTRVTSEFGKTVFGNWIITNAGESSSAYIIYKLPFKASNKGEYKKDLKENNKLYSLIAKTSKEASSYSLVFQKQSGTEPLLEKRIIYPEGWTPVWKSRDDLNLAVNGASLETVIKGDEIIAIVMEKQK